MEWLESYHKRKEELEKQDRIRIKEEHLMKLKKQHFQEKLDEILTLRNRIKTLQQELKSYE